MALTQDNKPFPVVLPIPPAVPDMEVSKFYGEVSNFLRRLRDAVIDKKTEPDIFTDSNRPDPTKTKLGTIIFNSDDGQLNVRVDPPNWTLPDGTIT